MSAIVFDSVSFHYEDPYLQVFEDLSLSVDTRWKTGLVGRNGRGKTTLLNLLRRKLQPSRGRIDVPVSVFYFPYAPSNPDETTFRVVKESVAPFLAWERRMSDLLRAQDEQSLGEYGELLERYERMGGYEIDAKIEQEFVRMGMDASLLARRFRTLSGGEQTRALIIPLFLKKGAFPLIDEPTNHLDMRGRALLGAYLAAKDGFIVVSHDRSFLDSCVDHIVSLNKSDVRVNQGDYSQWRAAMDAEEEFERRKNENLEREVRSLERAARKRRAWSDKKEHSAKHGDPNLRGMRDKGYLTARAADLMQRALAIERRMERKIEEKKDLLKNVEKKRELALVTGLRAPEVLASLHEVDVTLGGRQVLKGFSLTIRKGEQIAIVGDNGTGKTTILNVLSGEVRPERGTVSLPGHLKIVRAYQIPLWQRGFLREHLARARIDETRFRNVMAAFGVTGEVFDRPLQTFSEGERKKVDLCRSFLAPSHLLLWDEPLNYLDVMTREQIEKVVLERKPTLLFIEHDRYFVERTATEVVRLSPPVRS